MNATEFTGDTKIADALVKFYDEHGLGEKGGEDERWAKVQMGWFHFYIPNPESRKRALFFHDVHHIVTGYQTDLKSEAEIGAWEIGSGCKDFWAAWVLNYAALVLGLIICPIRTFVAFVRGRNSRNLYDGNLTKDAICESTIDDIRTKLGIDVGEVPLRVGDLLMFLLWVLPAMIVVLGVSLLLWWIAGLPKFAD